MSTLIQTVSYITQEPQATDVFLRPRQHVNNQVQVMSDAIGINGTLNTDRMLTMADHPRILFNFHVLFFEMIE